MRGAPARYTLAADPGALVQMTGITVDRPDLASSAVMAGAGALGLYGSGFLPEGTRTVGIVGSLALMGLGGYRLGNLLLGAGTPQISTVSIPRSQVFTDYGSLRASILKPASGTEADLSTLWQELYQGKQTYPVKFQIKNVGDQSGKLVVSLTTDEYPRLTGKKSVSESFIVDVAPGVTVTDVVMPVATDGMVIRVDAVMTLEINSAAYATSSFVLMPPA